MNLVVDSGVMIAAAYNNDLIKVIKNGFHVLVLLCYIIVSLETLLQVLLYYIP